LYVKIYLHETASLLILFLMQIARTLLTIAFMLC